MSENRIRHLDALISADGWHKKQTFKSRKLEVFAHISFHEGRLGGGENDQVEFKLQLLSAELIARPIGNVKINPESIFDQSSTKTRTKSETIKSQKSIEANASASATVKPTGLYPKIGANTKATGSHEVEKQITTQQDFFEISVTTSYDNNRNPIWRFSPAQELRGFDTKNAPYLSGRGWDPVNQSILTMLDNRKQDTKEIDPEVHLTVRCRREDFSIKDIRYKDNKGKWRNTGRYSKAKTFLAEEFIKNKLTEKGLVHDSGDGNHSIFILCDLLTAPMIEEEWNDD